MSQGNTGEQAPRVVANFRFISNIHHAGTRHTRSTHTILSQSQAELLCPVCRDFSHGLEIRHDIDGTCALLELEQKLVQNIEIDVAIKTLIVNLNTQSATLTNQAKAPQDELQGLREALELVQKERTDPVNEKRQLQSDKNAAFMQRDLIRNDLQIVQGKIQKLEEKETELQSEASIRQEQITKLEKESSANHEIVDRLEETVRVLIQEVYEKEHAKLSVQTENGVLQARLRDAEQSNSAQNEDLAKLQEDKRLLVSKLEEQSQAISLLIMHGPRSF